MHNLTTNPAWTRIRTWPRLSAEAKLAWLFLWDLSGADLAGASTVTCLSCALDAPGTYQGAGDARRMGTTTITELADAGLVKVLGKDDVNWQLELVDPETVPVQPMVRSRFVGGRRR